MVDRLVSGLITALLLCFSVLIVLAGFTLLSGRGRSFDSFAAFLWVHAGTRLMVLAIAGFFIGLWANIDRAADVFSHLWGTADPKKPWVTIGMWLCILLIWLAT